LLSPDHCYNWNKTTYGFLQYSSSAFVRALAFTRCSSRCL